MFASDLKHSRPSLEAKLVRLYGMGRKTINLTFRPPFLELLQAFGNPHKNLPPVIHVAGTNGKGSIVATLRSILEAQGYKVHAYTSPHLCRFNERICLAGRPIDDDFLESLIDEAIALNQEKDVTFFEITTSLAFAAFARTPADILLLETGLGGRQDCTNVIEQPLATIISLIGMDHVEYLGDTLEKIAGEKAGIMKRGVSCIVAKQNEETVTDVFENVSAILNATLFRAGAEWFSEAKQDRLRFVFKHGAESVERILPLPNLKGLHQIENCGAALAALEVIKDRFPVSDEARARGLQNIEWPGRLQDLTPAFRNVLPSGWEVWLDGAHNKDGARILSTQAQAWQTEDGKPLHLLVGMMRHKDPVAFVQPLLPFAKTVSFVDIPGEPASHKAAEMKEMLNHEGEAYNELLPALKSLATGPEGRILITGSLYLAGYVLKTAGSRAHNAGKENLTHAA
jgi:dihydrofolate synthase/folylpolyglutamate synthase